VYIFRGTENKLFEILTIFSNRSWLLSSNRNYRLIVVHQFDVHCVPNKTSTFLFFK